MLVKMSDRLKSTLICSPPSIPPSRGLRRPGQAAGSERPAADVLEHMVVVQAEEPFVLEPQNTTREQNSCFATAVKSCLYSNPSSMYGNVLWSFSIRTS